MTMMNIMVIGGTSGIGWALALHYLQAGHRVAVCGRNLDKIDTDAAARIHTSSATPSMSPTRRPSTGRWPTFHPRTRRWTC